MPDLDATVALVTGGSRGIGAAIARELAAGGADVAVTYQHAEQQAKAVVAEIEALGRRAIAMQADSADAAAVVGAGREGPPPPGGRAGARKKTRTKPPKTANKVKNENRAAA
ncbi:SDR family NAD(P)-dependent oxidoreductase, partial [Nocardia cyriacigeorgica]|uniref:SDR family NAD(P)-dependent oxidoreductase n=1 Tax=Nocardia cyriacigeorgica TaxID=135487 RepID=UPI002457851E